MLLRQTLLYLPAQIIGPLSQVIAAVTWTYWLAPAPYGLLTLLIASQDLIFLVGLSWWTHYTMRYLGGLTGADREGFAASEAPIFALAMVGQVVGTLIVLGFLHETITPRLALAAIAYVSTRSLLVHLCERARAQGRIAAYTIGQAGGSLGGFLLALVAVWRLAATPEVALMGFALAQVATIVALWVLLGISRGALVPGRALLLAALGFGFPLVIAGGFGWSAQNGIRIVVEQLAGLDAMGLIAVGWGLGQRLAATLAMVVIAASFPLAVKSLHEGSPDAAYRHLSQGGLLLIGLILPASIGLALLAEPLTTTFIAAPFRATTIAILPFAAAAGAVRNIRMHVADPVFLLIERPRINMAINVIDAFGMVIGCLVGLLVHGLVGAVIGCFGGAALAAAVGFVLAGALGGFRLPLAETLRLVAASAIMAFGLLVVPWPAFRLAAPARLIVETIAGIGVYGVALALLYPELIRRLVPMRGKIMPDARAGGG